MTTKTKSSKIRQRHSQQYKTESLALAEKVGLINSNRNTWRNRMFNRWHWRNLMHCIARLSAALCSRHGDALCLQTMRRLHSTMHDDLLSIRLESFPNVERCINEGTRPHFHKEGIKIKQQVSNVLSCRIDATSPQREFEHTPVQNMPTVRRNFHPENEEPCICFRYIIREMQPLGEM